MYIHMSLCAHIVIGVCHKMGGETESRPLCVLHESTLNCHYSKYCTVGTVHV